MDMEQRGAYSQTMHCDEMSQRIQWSEDPPCCFTAKVGMPLL